MNTIESGHLGQEYYASHPEANRTLRMDDGGICHFCAAKTSRRVELHSPLWPSGPILYGDCCLPSAEAALRGLVSGDQPKRPVFQASRTPVSYTAWLTAAALAVMTALAVGLERLLPAGRSF